MCNNYRLNVDLDTIASDFSDLRVRIDFPEGRPNVEARDDVRITDVAPIVRPAGDGGVTLVQRRWSWPGPSGRPVYNFRSEGRSFGAERCLVVADGFYEFTAPEAGAKLKTKWLFTMPGHRWFGIAGIMRTHPDVGEAFTMLTVDPARTSRPTTPAKSWRLGATTGCGGSIPRSRRATCWCRRRRKLSRPSV